MPDEVTYAEVFALLQRLGFRDSSSSDSERVFQHPESGIVLAFAMLDDPSPLRPVRPADLLSTEMRLQHHGLIAGPIRDAIERVRDASR